MKYFGTRQFNVMPTTNNLAKFEIWILLVVLNVSNLTLPLDVKQSISLLQHYNLKT
jgi:hypothetical protein